MTSDYRRLEGGAPIGGVDAAEAAVQRRLQVIDRVSRAEAVLQAAHPALALAVGGWWGRA